jgi:hypothetical protein
MSDPMIGTPAGRVDRYGVALALIVLSIIVVTSLGSSPAARTISTALLGLTLVFVLAASDVRVGVVRGTAALVVVGIVAMSLGWLVGTPVAASAFTGGVGIALVTVGPFVIARRLVRRGRVTAHTLFGAVCIYLFIGLAFAYLFSILDAIDGPFLVQVDEPPFSDLLYFSYTTLATIGFGDFTARTEGGRMIAVFEGITGQLYIASIVALVVANLGGEIRRDRAR